MKTRAALTKIFLKPGAVFVALKSEQKWVAAAVVILLMLALHSIVTSLGTYSNNRVDTVIESQSPIALSYQGSKSTEVPAADKSADRTESETDDGFPSLDSRRYSTGSFILWLLMLVGLLPFGLAILCFLCFLDAVYFRIVGAILNVDYRLSDWFALAVWSRVPWAAFSVIVVIVGLIALGRQPESDGLEILTISRWVDLPAVKYEDENWSIGLSLEHLEASLLWIIALQTIGFREWSGKTALFSFGVAVIPTLITIVVPLAVISLS